MLLLFVVVVEFEYALCVFLVYSHYAMCFALDVLISVRLLVSCC